jgi:hypothetical protein
LRTVCKKYLGWKNNRDSCSDAKILCHQDATYGNDGTNYHYLHSWTNKMII